VLEFLDRLRQHRSELPFILFTGKGNEEIASEAITAGVTDYLQKETGTDQYRVLANRIHNSV
jgi:DNA-binding NtrC family response regulator